MKTLISFLLIFSIIVIFHEFGHYYFAKKAGIFIREFAIGMGPKLFSHQGMDGTVYTLRMLPLGGYVRMASCEEDYFIDPGMQLGLILNEANEVTSINLSNKNFGEELPFQVDAFKTEETLTIQGFTNNQEDRQSFNIASNAIIIEKDGSHTPLVPYSRTYEAAKAGQKIMTNFAGPMNNFILTIVAYIIFAFLIPGVPSHSNIIGEVIDQSPAYHAKLQADDQIIQINDQEIHHWEDLTAYIADHPNQEASISFLRNGSQSEAQVTIAGIEDPNSQKIYGQLGIKNKLETSFLSRVKFGFTETWQVTTGILAALASMFSSKFSLDNFGGPVAIAQMTGNVVDSGFAVTLSFLAMLSANLGVFNLLPIPALDGGKIVLNMVELVRGRSVDKRLEGALTLVSVLILVLLMLAVTWNDLLRLFQ